MYLHIYLLTYLKHHKCPQWSDVINGSFITVPIIFMFKECGDRRQHIRLGLVVTNKQFWLHISISRERLSRPLFCHL